MQEAVGWAASDTIAVVAVGVSGFSVIVSALVAWRDRVDRRKEARRAANRQLRLTLLAQSQSAVLAVRDMGIHLNPYSPGGSPDVAISMAISSDDGLNKAVEQLGFLAVAHPWDKVREASDALRRLADVYRLKHRILADQAAKAAGGGYELSAEPKATEDLVELAEGVRKAAEELAELLRHPEDDWQS